MFKEVWLGCAFQHFRPLDQGNWRSDRDAAKPTRRSNHGVTETDGSAVLQPDVVIIDGSETHKGWIGRFTRSGVSKSAFSGMIGLLLPSIVAAAIDTEGQNCHLLTDFMRNVDIRVPHAPLNCDEAELKS